MIAIALLTLLYLGVLYPWMNRWGATDAELSMPLPGDGTQLGLGGHLHPGGHRQLSRPMKYGSGWSSLARTGPAFTATTGWRTWSSPISITRTSSARIGSHARWATDPWERRGYLPRPGLAYPGLPGRQHGVPVGTDRRTAGPYGCAHLTAVYAHISPCLFRDARSSSKKCPTIGCTS